MVCRGIEWALIYPYSYHSQETPFFDCAVKGNILGVRFEWFEGNFLDTTLLALLKHFLII